MHAVEAGEKSQRGQDAAALRTGHVGLRRLRKALRNADWEGLCLRHPELD